MTARHRLEVFGWTLILVGCGVVLLVAPVPAPPADLGSLAKWPANVGAVPAALGIIRVAGLAATGTTLTAAGLGLVARVTRSIRVTAACDRWTLPAVRRLLDRVAAGSVAAAVVVTPMRVGASEAPPPTPVLRSLDTPPPSLRRLEPAPPPSPPPRPDAPHTSAPTPEPAPAVDEHTAVVQPGDSFWAIAERLVTERHGRPVSTAEVDRYWRRLVEANLDRLAVDGEPDLIFAGQRFVLPDFPGADG